MTEGMMRQLVTNLQRKTLRMEWSECSWGEGVALWGLNYSMEHVPCPEYLPRLCKWIEGGLQNDKFQYTVNNSIACVGLGEYCKRTGNTQYIKRIRKQAEYLLHDAPRLDNGAIIHSDPYAKFGRQMWADTIFMAGLFLAYAGKMLNEPAYTQEAMNQLTIHVSVLQDADGLLYHGWDETLCGHIGCKWNRANAWVSVGIVEMLDYMPANEIMLTALKRQLDAAAPWQKSGGLWRTVLDGKSSYLEASCAYGFGYAILKGIRLGVLDRKYLSIVEKMEQTLIFNVDKYGKVKNISAGTPVMRNENEYNIICQHRAQHWGQGLALMYFTEYCKYKGLQL